MNLIRSDSTVYVAVDPGGTTGIAMTDGERFTSDQVEGRFAFYDALDAFIAEGYPIELVIESYTITANTAKLSRQYDPLYIIGHLEAQTRKLGIYFEMQSPSQGKGFGTDAKLKHLGWWNPTPGGHANDAARHLSLFVYKRAPALIEPKLRELLI